MSDQAKHIERAHKLLSGVWLDKEQTEYAYYAGETCSYWSVSRSDLVDLGERLAADQDGNAYSCWCTDCGEEISEADVEWLGL